jgi:tyrosinase
MGETSVGDGRCVTNGPFADLEVMYYDGDELPHCLSRGFADETELKELGALVQPATIDELMAEDDYEVFATELEKRAHKFLSHSVRGDLSRFTGPNGKLSFVSVYGIVRGGWVN